MDTKNSTETKKLAKRIADRAVRKGPQKSGATIFALVGDLGSGKTTFAQGFIKELGIKQRIISPTFLIFRKYKLADKSFSHAYHADLYRIKSVNELYLLGFKEILENPKNIILIEWAEKVKDSIPKRAKWIYFEHGQAENIRTIKTSDILDS